LVSRSLHTQWCMHFPLKDTESVPQRTVYASAARNVASWHRSCSLVRVAVLPCFASCNSTGIAANCISRAEPNIRTAPKYKNDPAPNIMTMLSKIAGSAVVMALTALVCAPPFLTYCYSMIFAYAPPLSSKRTTAVAKANSFLICRRKRLVNVRTPKLAASEVNHPTVGGVQHEYAECEGCRIHIARAGVDRSKQCILFLHGFPEYASVISL
jgi:hypothetical protein